MKYGQFGTGPHTTPCIPVSRTIPIFIKFYLQGIFHKYSVFYTYDTQFIYAKCRQFDGGIKLLDHFDTFKKWQILV